VSSLVLALDLGTGGCKGAVYTREGLRVALESRDYATSRPAPGIVEQDPRDYIAAAGEVAGALMAGHAIAAVGFSTQTPTLVLLDEHCQPLRPAIVWQDSRATAEAAELEAIHPEIRRAWFGFDLPVGPTAAPAKLLWLRRHEPEIWERTRWVAQPKDLAAHSLTGVLATDAWCAKGIASVATGVMHPDWMAYLDLAVDVSPPCRPMVRRGDGLTVDTGWSDALCAILASGAVEGPGRGFILTGTSEIIGATRADSTAAPGLFHVPSHVLGAPGVDLHFGPIQGGGATLQWLARFLDRTPEAIFDLAATPDLTPVLFHPYLEGERAPYWNSNLTAGVRGLRAHHGPADLARAVLQGVALQERLVLERARAGVALDTVTLAGGAARAPVWNQMRANILQRPLRVMEDLEASLRGAAMLAWRSLTGEPAPAAWLEGHPVEPCRGQAALASELFARFTMELPV